MDKNKKKEDDKHRVGDKFEGNRNDAEINPDNDLDARAQVSNNRGEIKPEEIIQQDKNLNSPKTESAAKMAGETEAEKKIPESIKVGFPKDVAKDIPAEIIDT